MLKPITYLFSLPFMLSPLVAASQVALTPPSAEQPSADGGRVLKFGNVLMVPSAEVRWGHDDNLTQAPDTLAQPAMSSAFWLVNAGLAADLEHKGDRYSLTYLGAYTRYSASSVDNTDVHNLKLQGANVFNVRNAVRWESGLMDGYDPRGSTDATTAVAEPSHYRSYRFGGTYAYGAEGAKGRVEGDAAYTTKEYLNNRASMATADVDTTELNGRFFWRVMPKTSAVLDLRLADYNYTAVDAGLDSRSVQILTGANWEATGATSGSFRVGHTSRRYAERGDFNGPSWEVGVTWKPLTYSTLNLTTGRNIADTSSGEPGSVGDYVLATTYGAGWSHDWRSNLRTEFAWNHTKSDYEGVARLDKQDNYKAGVHYNFRRWMSVGVEINYTDRRSNVPEFTFNRLQSMVLVRGQF